MHAPIVPSGAGATVLGMAFPSEQELRAAAEPLAAALGFDVEAVSVTRAGAKSAVKIAVDGDVRPSLDQLEELSQAVSGQFDALEEAGRLKFGPGYTLELSTPGLDTPLTAERHFRRNVGRLVLVRGEKLRVAAVDGDTVWFIRPAAKKKGSPGVVPRQLAESAGALVEVEFSEAPAAESALVGLDPEKYRALTAQEDDK